MAAAGMDRAAVAVDTGRRSTVRVVWPGTPRVQGFRVDHDVFVVEAIDGVLLAEVARRVTEFCAATTTSAPINRGRAWGTGKC